ncbi:MAG: tetratricopeptide repeat protein [Acidobacteriales bacterium]|nr:tetratricopeptide repeat protein [Terriglobales bacterium]
MAETRLGEIKTFAHKPMVVLAALLIFAVAGFVAVGRLVRAFQTRQQILANRVFMHAKQQRQMGSINAAITGFRAALDYSPGNFDYELNLAETLADANLYEQARTYLLNLWERAPQNAEVNLQLARVSRREGKTQEAIRYYHNAIYGIWMSDPERERRLTRIELVDLLLEHNETTQARAELIASLASPPSDPGLRTSLGDLLARTGDYRDAIAQYEAVLKADPRQVEAQLGLAHSNFQLQDYSAAARYFAAAAKIRPLGTDDTELWNVSRLIQENDPYRRELSEAARRQRIATAFEQAGSRLQSCATTMHLDLEQPEQPTPLAQLYYDWSALSKALGKNRLHKVSEDDTIRLVFRIEDETQKACGPARGLDRAFWLIGKQGQGSAQ